MAEDEVAAAVEPRRPHARAPLDVPPVSPGARAGVVVHASIATAVRTLLMHEPQLRDGIDDEAVHRARVATRRLRSDLRTFTPLLERDWVTWTTEELRWLGGCLGEARDADVLLARIEGALNRVPVAQVDHDALLAPLAQRRQTARRALRDALRTRRYGRLLDTLEGAARQPQLRGAAHKRATKVLAPLVEDRWRALRHEVKRTGRSPAPDQLHKIRIRAKRLRYAAEAASPAFGTPARRFAKRIEEVQELLGNHHDAVVAAAWLRDIGSEADARLAFLAGEIAGIEEAEAAAVTRAWPAAWRQARRKRHRAWL